MNYILFFFAIIGGGWVFWNFVVPVADWILRMIGYGIFEFKVTSWRKAKSWQQVLKYLFVVIPALCLRESGTIGSVWASSVSAKGLTWRPYFHYEHNRPDS